MIFDCRPDEAISGRRLASSAIPNGISAYVAYPPTSPTLPTKCRTREPRSLSAADQLQESSPSVCSVLTPHFEFRPLNSLCKATNTLWMHFRVRCR